MNLVRVPHVFGQIWNRSSYPERPDSPVPAIVGWWWAGWLVGGLARRIANGLVSEGAPLSQLLAASWMAIVAEVIYIATALCAIAIVRGIDHMQESRPSEEETSPTPIPRIALAEGQHSTME